VYVQDLATLSEHWKLLAGVRYDDFQQETRERRPGQPNLDRTDRAWSPRVGLVYQPTATQSYYASFSKSFQPSGENFPLAANNAAIEPEETTNKEVGAKLDLFGGLASLGASLFRLERTNIKTTDPVTNRLLPIGTQRTDGLELSLSGELGQGWLLSSSYAWLDAKVTESIARDDGQPVQGKRATLTPRHSASVWLSKALGGGFGAGAGVNAVGARFANPGNTVTLPGYATVDAMAYYRAAAWEAQLNLTNLADRNYIIAAHGSSKFLNLPGAPRAIQLTARYRF
jgi:catecholate siderophore receptor